MVTRATGGRAGGKVKAYEARSPLSRRGAQRTITVIVNDALQAEADGAASRGNLTAAIEVARRSRPMDPADAPAWALLAKLAAIAGDDARVIKSLAPMLRGLLGDLALSPDARARLNITVLPEIEPDMPRPARLARWARSPLDGK